MRRSYAAALLFVVPAACGFDWTVVPRSDDGGPPPGDDAGVDAAELPCRTNDDCPSDRYCAFADRRCGAGEPGRCAKVPLSTTCHDLDLEPTCLCTGDVAKTRCLGAANGADVSIDGACYNPVPDMFRCGFLFCNAWELCVETVEAGVVDYACRPWDCKVPSCACPVAANACAAPTCRSVDGGIVARCEE